MKKISFKNHIYTDLAIESKEVVEEDFPKGKIDGVKVEEDIYDDENIKVTKVEIINKDGEELLGKPVGKYITIEANSVTTGTAFDHNNISEVLVTYIKELGKISSVKKILIVGLGNDNVSADSLGPKVANKILVTRHIVDGIPDDLSSKIRVVSSIVPGVMGQTGIETVETVKGIVKKIKPDLVIAIDALAARKANRINTTIQLSDTGITPGSGVNNKRKGLNYDTLGVPVIAVGVPTVISATTMVNDTIDTILERLSLKDDVLSNMSYEDKFDLISDVLDPYVGSLYVTPKEVDYTIRRLTNIISNSINLALHDGLNLEEINGIMDGHAI